MTASIEIRGVFYSGTVGLSEARHSVLLVGTGSALLRCNLQFDAKARTGVGECFQGGFPPRYEATLLDGD